MPSSPSPTTPRGLARRLLLSVLEDRSVPATLTGLTATNQLVTFDSGSPQTITATVNVTGLQQGESLLGIDYRPANGQLYGVGSTSRIYRIDPATGAATGPGGTGTPAPFTPTLSGGVVGFDFNPVPDKIRLVTNTGQSLRLNADTGVVVGTDTPLAYDATTFDLQVGGAAPAPQISAAAYTKNLPNPGSTATVTTLYGLDANLDVLVTQGGPEGDPSPNGGQLFVVGPTNFDVTADSGFDIEAGTDMAFATRTTGGATELYGINITTGGGTLLGTLPGQTLRGLSVAPAVGGAGAVSLSASTFTFPAGRGPVAVTVTRTGGASLPATIDFATADAATTQVVGGARAAVAGVDYVPTSGTLSFAAGETTKTVFLALPAGSVPTSSPAVFAFNLSNPTGGLTLGSTAAALVTIPAVTATNSGRLFAVGAGVGGSPVVAVYDAVSGAELYRFLAFEQTFTGGVYVASADVNGDGFDDIITGAGAGGGPRIAVFDGSVTDRSLTNRGAILADFFAYEEAARVGVIVAAGDVSGDGIADVIAGTGVGGGPRVRVIDGTALTTTPGALQPSIADFFAYESSARGGVNVAAGEFTGDGFADVVAGSGNGGGPRVRLFDGTAIVGNGTPNSLSDYFAYEEGFRGGVFVAAGDVDGDNFSDLITGTGVGGGPRVSVFSRGREAQRTGDFFAFDGAFRGGVRVAAEDFGADGSDSVVTAPGRGAPGTFRTFTPTGTQVSETTFDAGFTGGLFIG